MPNRILRDWTTSETIDKLTSGAEVLFTRLIMKADDYGNYTANPKLIKAALFPLKSFTDFQIEEWIDECSYLGIIKKYTIEGKEYVNIPNFGQRLRAMKSQYPDIGQSDDRHMSDIGRPETKRNEENEKRSQSQDFFSDKSEAFESIKLDDLFIEEVHLTISGRGWKACDKMDVVGLLKNFLLGKADLETPKKNVRQHFKNWIIREKLENLQTISQVFKTSLNGKA